MNKDLIKKCMKYVYYDLAVVKQSNGLSDKVGLEYEKAFERLLGTALVNMQPSWKDIYRMIKNKLLPPKVNKESNTQVSVQLDKWI